MSNYPPGAKNDKNAPYNQKPSVIQKKAVDVTVGVTIEVPKQDEGDTDWREIEAALERGEFDLLDIVHEEVLDEWRA